MKTKVWLYALMIASLIAWSACDDDDDDNDRSLNDTDENFVEKAALANMTEVEFGKLAATNASDSSVKSFGQHMVTEHTTALNELKSISDNYDGIDWPSGMDQQHKDMHDQLMGMSGYAFDSLYIHSQVMDHQTTRDLFQSEVSGGNEQRVRSYASKYLPHIEEHLAKADSIQNMLAEPPPQAEEN